MALNLFIHGVAKSLYRATIQILALPYGLSPYSQSIIYDTYPFLSRATALLGLSSRDFFASATASVGSQFKGGEHNNMLYKATNCESSSNENFLRCIMLAFLAGT